MATVGELVDSISRRIRDPMNTGVSRAVIRQILDYSQLALNGFNSYVLTEIDLPIVPGQTIYRIETELPDHMWVTDVEFDNIYLDEIRSWRTLWKLSPTWLTDVGPPRGWSQIGKRLLVVYPVPLYRDTVRVKGPLITTTLTDDLQDMDLRDEDSDIARDLTVAVLLFRQKDLDMVPNLVRRILAKIGLQQPAITEEMRDVQRT